MTLIFEWDADKARRNLQKHGVSFDEACTAFHDPLSITIPDPLHSDSEERFILLGRSSISRLLVVVHVERASHLRIISARRATRKEGKVYEEASL